MNLTGYNRKYGACPTKEDIQADILYGIRKYLSVGMLDQVLLLERRLIQEFGMSPSEIEMEVFDNELS